MRRRHEFRSSSSQHLVEKLSGERCGWLQSDERRLAWFAARERPAGEFLRFNVVRAASAEREERQPSQQRNRENNRADLQLFPSPVAHAVILATFQDFLAAMMFDGRSGRLRLSYRVYEQPNGEQDPETDPETNGSSKHVP